MAKKSNLMLYPAFFHKEESQDLYWVEFPDLKGCQIVAPTIAEAMEKAQKELGEYLITVLGKAPAPSDPATLMPPADGFTSMIMCDLKAVQKAKAQNKRPRKTIKRENGMGSVSKRKDMKNHPWVARSPATYDEYGKQSYITLGYFDTAQEAKKALADFLEHPTSQYDYTLEDVYKAWSDVHYRSLVKGSINGYKGAFQYMIPLHGTPLRFIKTADMQKVIDDNNFLSASYLAKIKALFHMLMDYGVQNDIISKNYAEFIKLPKAQPPKKDSFSALELATLEQHANVDEMAQLILIMCYTGFRINEFLSLTVFQYDTVQKTLTGGSKTEAGRNRVVPIHPKIQQYVDEWANRRGAVLFCNEDGNRFNIKRFREIYYQTLERYHIRRLTPHTTRHTFATMLSAAGARPEDIQKILGHSKYDITATTYIHQSVDTLRNAVNLLK